uniref:Uncharacterized protein n=1 Tax=Phlebotomus papatasi TaxID=29031 RepID=A0A1B0DIN0_PHLPP
MEKLDMTKGIVGTINQIGTMAAKIQIAMGTGTMIGINHKDIQVQDDMMIETDTTTVPLIMISHSNMEGISRIHGIIPLVRITVVMDMTTGIPTTMK